MHQRAPRQAAGHGPDNEANRPPSQAGMCQNTATTSSDASPATVSYVPSSLPTSLEVSSDVSESSIESKQPLEPNGVCSTYDPEACTTPEESEEEDNAAVSAFFHHSFCLESVSWPMPNQLRYVGGKYEPTIFSNREIIFPIDSPVAHQLFPQVVEIVRDNMIGNGSTYPFFSMYRKGYTQTIGELAMPWVEQNTHRMKFAGRDYHLLEGLAKELSDHLGFSQRLTATHLVQRTTFIGINRGPGRRGLSEANMAAFELCVDLCFLALNFIRRPPMTVPDDMVLLFKEVRQLDWLFAASMIVGRHTGLALNPISIKARVKLSGDGRITDRQALRIWNHFTLRGNRQYYDTERAAAGGRPVGLAFAEDLVRSDCNPLPLTPDKGGAHLAKGRWIEFPPPFGRMDDEQVQNIRWMTQDQRYACCKQTIRLRGLPTHVLPHAVSWRELESLMTPPHSAVEGLKVIITRLAIRITDDGDPEAEIAFADAMHAHVARLRTHFWINSLGLEMPTEVPLPNTCGMEHPLSALRTLLRGSLPISNIRAQVAMARTDFQQGGRGEPIAPMTAHVFDRVTTDNTGTATFVKVRYGSPTEAKKMLGTFATFDANITGTRNSQTTRLCPHITRAHPLLCTSCWKLGHGRNVCLEMAPIVPAQDSGLPCLLCQQTHDQSVLQCPAIAEYYRQANRMLAEAVNQPEMSIFASRNDELFRDLFALHDEEAALLLLPVTNTGTSPENFWSSDDPMSEQEASEIDEAHSIPNASTGMA